MVNLGALGAFLFLGADHPTSSTGELSLERRFPLAAQSSKGPQMGNPG